jgi:hypothetical protein
MTKTLRGVTLNLLYSTKEILQVILGEREAMRDTVGENALKGEVKQHSHYYPV